MKANQRIVRDLDLVIVIPFVGTMRVCPGTEGWLAAVTFIIDVELGHCPQVLVVAARPRIQCGVVLLRRCACLCCFGFELAHLFAICDQCIVLYLDCVVHLPLSQGAILVGHNHVFVSIQLDLQRMSHRPVLVFLICNAVFLFRGVHAQRFLLRRLPGQELGWSRVRDVQNIPAVLDPLQVIPASFMAVCAQRTHVLETVGPKFECAARRLPRSQAHALVALALVAVALIITDLLVLLTALMEVERTPAPVLHRSPLLLLLFRQLLGLLGLVLGLVGLAGAAVHVYGMCAVVGVVITVDVVVIITHGVELECTEVRLQP